MGDIIRVEITGYSKKGYGLSQIGERKKCYVFGGVKGDIVDVDVIKKKRRDSFGVISKVITRSESRIEPLCKHFAMCGGCSLQTTSYESQLQHKLEKIQEIASPLSVDVQPIIPCKKTTKYRSKMEFSCDRLPSGENQLGLIIAESKGRVISLDMCFIAHELIFELYQTFFRVWNESDIAPYSIKTQKGSLRRIVIRTNGDGKALLNVVFDDREHLSISQKEALLAPFINDTRVSVYMTCHAAYKGVPTKETPFHISGDEYLIDSYHISYNEIVHKYHTYIGPFSFSQPHIEQKSVIYANAIEMADVSKNDIVYDLFSGSGAIGMALSPFAKEIISIEINEEAVILANKAIKEQPCLSNMTALQGDVFDILSSRKGDMPTPSIVIVDPPRAGLGEKCLNEIITLKPQKIVYISCNPLSLVTDAETIIGAGYKASSLLPIDQFPHTVHVEAVMVFSLQ